MMDEQDEVKRSRVQRQVMPDSGVRPRQAIQKRRLSDEEPAKLCSRCTSLDIDQLQSSTSTKIPLGPISSWNIKSCAFCTFLRDLLSPILGTNAKGRQDQNPRTEVEFERQSSQSFYLYSMRTRQTSERLLQNLATRLIVLSDAEHGPAPDRVPYIAVHPTKSPFWIKPIQSLIDFDQPKEWLKICSHLHADRCSGDQESIVANLKLIDCSTGDVVEAKADDQYVALSYVWGKESVPKKDGAKYPQTVQDAIIATQKLGFTRLWVDKYCIDQDNKPELHNQLQQMDAIYQHAAVTLIAAAGEDADYGLPGVSKHLRTPTPSVMVHQQTLSAIRCTPDIWSDDCKWASRAWTYQEGLLASKRLVFTDDHLYFECQGLYCTEMLDISLENWKDMHHTHQPFLHSRHRVAPRMGIFPLDGCGVVPWDIYCRINEYSKRSLSFDNDILNGMLGIFRAFEREKNPMRHLYGIPFPEVARSSPNMSTSETGSKLTLPTFSESLRWTLEVPSERRKGFPSWSWTGWFGRVVWPPEYIGARFPQETARKVERPRNPKVNESAIRLSIELRNGGTVNWTELQTRYHELLITNETNGIIYIEAYTTPTVYSHDSGHTNVSLRLRREDGQFSNLIAKRTTTRMFNQEDKFFAIHFHRTVSGNQDRVANARSGATVKQHVLIARDMGSHWERVAIGSYMIDAQKNMDRIWQTLRLG